MRVDCISHISSIGRDKEREVVEIVVSLRIVDFERDSVNQTSILPDKVQVHYPLTRILNRINQVLRIIMIEKFMLLLINTILPRLRVDRIVIRRQDQPHILSRVLLILSDVKQ